MISPKGSVSSKQSSIETNDRNDLGRISPTLSGGDEEYGLDKDSEQTHGQFRVAMGKHKGKHPSQAKNDMDPSSTSVRAHVLLDGVFDEEMISESLENDDFEEQASLLEDDEELVTTRKLRRHLRVFREVLEQELSHMRRQVASPFYEHENFVDPYANTHEDEEQAQTEEGSNGDDNDKVGEDEEEGLLPEDTFSFLATSEYFNGSWRHPTHAFVAAFGVFALQILTLSLLTIDVVDRNSKPNALGFPGNVSWAVRASQLIALFITLISQDEVRQSLNVMYNGYDVYARFCEAHPTSGIYISRSKWYFSLITRLLAGALSLAVTFILIMVTDSVRDLLLNFTAVEFISQVDDGVYMLSSWGYFGSHLRKSTKVVEQVTTSKKVTHRQNRRFPRAWCLMALAIIMLGFWIWITWQQEMGFYLCQNFYVQFGDEFSPGLGTFSGIYSMHRLKTWIGAKRVDYLEFQDTPWKHGPKFGYCDKMKAWTFTHGLYSHQVEARCDKESIRAFSTETESFDIKDTASDPWFYQNRETEATPQLQQFSMICLDGFSGQRCRNDDDCGKRLVCEGGKCLCMSGYYGVSCQYREPCSRIQIDESFGGFSDSREWSSAYDILRSDQTNRPIQVHGKPVYLGAGEPLDGDYDIMMYTGRRWVLTNSGKINDFSSRKDTNRSMIASVLTGEFHAYWSNYSVTFISEAVDIGTPEDVATPAALRWFHATAQHQDQNVETRTQSLDLHRPSNTVLLCVTCNNDTNPCLYEGTCSQDGTCICTNGAQGELCQIPPIGDGQCDLYFNTTEFDYDGGDC